MGRTNCKPAQIIAAGLESRSPNEKWNQRENLFDTDIRTENENVKTRLRFVNSPTYASLLLDVGDFAQPISAFTLKKFKG